MYHRAVRTAVERRDDLYQQAAEIRLCRKLREPGGTGNRRWLAVTLPRLGKRSASIPGPGTALASPHQTAAASQVTAAMYATWEQ
jgi:hypothetical protein